MGKKVRLKIHLKAKIIESGYTMDEVAREIGITPGSLSKICAEHYQDVHGSTMLRLAKVLNLHPDEIWEPLED